MPAGVLLSEGYVDSLVSCCPLLTDVFDRFDPEPDARSAYYFNYHHSQADTFTVIDPQGVANSVAAFGVMCYVLADMPTRLPTNVTTSWR